MTESSAVDLLMQEHRVILEVVKGLEAIARGLRHEGPRVDTTLLEEAVRFMSDYADRFHHAKEEDLLFPSLVAHGVPLHGCPIDALLHEHRRGRELVAEIAARIGGLAERDPDSGLPLAATIDALVELYTNHVWKEDVMVFPMVERLLPAEERTRLDAQCGAVAESFAPGMQARFEDFARCFTAATAKG